MNRLYLTGDLTREEIMYFCKSAVEKELAIYLGMTAKRFYFWMGNKCTDDDYICCFYVPRFCESTVEELCDTLALARAKINPNGLRILADEVRNAVWNGVMAYNPS